MVLKPPWDRDWLRVSPEEFERITVDILRSFGRELIDFSVSHRTRLTGPDGEFEIDAVARFQFLGAEFLVLVECKHHRNPIKRELVQVLRDKARALNAQKAMLFSTAPFQDGAIDYAQSQRIALVHVTEGGLTYETRDLVDREAPRRDHDAYWVTVSEKGGHLYAGVAGISEFLFT